MQNLKIDGLLNTVMMNAANVCGNLTTIKASFNELKKEIEAKDEEIEKCYKHTMYLEKELEKTRTCKNVEVGMLKEENDNLKAQNERLKTEVTEALAKRDYWQDFANKEANEAADAKKVKQDCEKEMEWQKKKLQEFDYVLTKYRAKIKELEGHFELDEESQLAILAGAYAIRYKYFNDKAYYNVAANGIISWKHAEQVLMNMITKE